MRAPLERVYIYMHVTIRMLSPQVYDPAHFFITILLVVLVVFADTADSYRRDARQVESFVVSSDGISHGGGRTKVANTDQHALVEAAYLGSAKLRTETQTLVEVVHLGAAKAQVEKQTLLEVMHLGAAKVQVEKQTLVEVAQLEAAKLQASLLAVGTKLQDATKSRFMCILSFVVLAAVSCLIFLGAWELLNKTSRQLQRTRGATQQLPGAFAYFSRGDHVCVLKASRLKGKTGVVVKASWHGMVKIMMDEDDADGKIKSFKPEELEHIEQSPQAGDPEFR